MTIYNEMRECKWCLIVDGQICLLTLSLNLTHYLFLPCSLFLLNTPSVVLFFLQNIVKHYLHVKSTVKHFLHLCSTVVTALTATYSTLHYGKRGGHNLSQLYENLFSSFWPTSSRPLWVAGDLCFTQKYFSYDPLSVKTSPTVLCGIPKSQLIWRSQWVAHVPSPNTNSGLIWIFQN